MSELTLKHGPVLEYRRWVSGEGDQDGYWADIDVTSRAHEYLFDTVQLAEGLVLEDIFKLLDAAPVLKDVLRREFCEELLVETRKGLSARFVPGYSADAIEYLELYQTWSFNSATRTHLPMHQLQFHGIGYALREPLSEHGFTYPQGHRIHWGVACTPVREMLSLPIRINNEVPVCEDNVESAAFGRQLEMVKVGGVSLGQVLHGVLWELSFHGGPAQAAEFAADLSATAASIQDGTANLVPLADVLSQLGQA